MVLAKNSQPRRPARPDALQQDDRLVMLIERLRGILARQLEERDTSIDWEDGERYGDDQDR